MRRSRTRSARTMTEVGIAELWLASVSAAMPTAVSGGWDSGEVGVAVTVLPPRSAATSTAPWCGGVGVADFPPRSGFASTPTPPRCPSLGGESRLDGAVGVAERSVVAVFAPTSTTSSRAWGRRTVPSVGELMLATGFAATLDTDPTGAMGRMEMRGVITGERCGRGGCRDGVLTTVRARTFHSGTLAAVGTRRNTAVSITLNMSTITHGTPSMVITMPQVCRCMSLE